MGIAVGQSAPTIQVAAEGGFQDQARSGLSYLGRNRQLILGIVLLGGLLLFIILGNLFYDVAKAALVPPLPSFTVMLTVLVAVGVSDVS